MRILQELTAGAVALWHWMHGMLAISRRGPWIGVVGVGDEPLLASSRKALVEALKGMTGFQRTSDVRSALSQLEESNLVLVESLGDRVYARVVGFGAEQERCGKRVRREGQVSPAVGGISGPVGPSTDDDGGGCALEGGVGERGEHALFAPHPDPLPQGGEGSRRDGEVGDLAVGAAARFLLRASASKDGLGDRPQHAFEGTNLDQTAGTVPASPGSDSVVEKANFCHLSARCASTGLGAQEVTDRMSAGFAVSRGDEICHEGDAHRRPLGDKDLTPVCPQEPRVGARVYSTLPKPDLKDQNYSTSTSMAREDEKRPQSISDLMKDFSAVPAHGGTSPSPSCVAPPAPVESSRVEPANVLPFAGARGVAPYGVDRSQTRRVDSSSDVPTGGASSARSEGEVPPWAGTADWRNGQVQDLVMVTSGQISRRWICLLLEAWCVTGARVDIWCAMKRRFEDIIREGGTEIRNPTSYFTQMVKKSATQSGLRWQDTWPVSSDDPMGGRSVRRPGRRV